MRVPALMAVKELERRPDEPVRYVPLMPLVMSREPRKEEEPVLLLVMIPPRVRVDEILAVPPTSKVTSW